MQFIENLEKNPKLQKYRLVAMLLVAFVLLLILLFLLMGSGTKKSAQTYQPSQQQTSAKNMSWIRRAMEEASQTLKGMAVSDEQIQKDMSSASQDLKKIPVPSAEDMQETSRKLNQSIK